MFKELEIELNERGKYTLLHVLHHGKTIDYRVETKKAEGNEVPSFQRLGRELSEDFFLESGVEHLLSLLRLSVKDERTGEGESGWRVRFVEDEDSCDTVNFAGQIGDALSVVVIEPLMSIMDRFFGTSFIDANVVDTFQMVGLFCDFPQASRDLLSGFSSMQLAHVQRLCIERSTGIVRFSGRHPSQCCDYRLEMLNENLVREALDGLYGLTRMEDAESDTTRMGDLDSLLDDDDLLLGFGLAESSEIVSGVVLKFGLHGGEDRYLHLDSLADTPKGKVLSKLIGPLGKSLGKLLFGYGFMKPHVFSDSSQKAT